MLRHFDPAQLFLPNLAPACSRCQDTGAIFDHTHDCPDHRIPGELCSLGNDFASCGGALYACGCPAGNEADLLMIAEDLGFPDATVETIVKAV